MPADAPPVTQHDRDESIGVREIPALTTRYTQNRAAAASANARTATENEISDPETATRTVPAAASITAWTNVRSGIRWVSIASVPITIAGYV